MTEPQDKSRRKRRFKLWSCWRRLLRCWCCFRSRSARTAVERLGDDLVRSAVIEQVGNLTGGGANLGPMEFDPWGLRVTVQDLTIHGRRPVADAAFPSRRPLRSL